MTLCQPATKQLTPRLAEWRTWQQAQSLSQRTVTERIGAILRMAAWIGADPATLRSEQIIEWLADGGDWAVRTRATYHGAAAAWFRWLKRMDYRVDDPMDKVGKIRQPRCEPRPVSDDAIRRLLRSRMRRTTRSMVVLAAFQGLRAHEIAKVKGEHFDLIAHTLVVTGKGGKRATLPVHSLVLEQAFQMPRKGYWFPGADNGHQYRTGVSSTVKTAMRRAGITGSCHQLRHYFCTALVRAGVDLRTVQLLARHSDLSSTAIYTAVADEQRADGIKRLDPFGVANMRPVENVSAERLRAEAAKLLALADRMAASESDR